MTSPQSSRLARFSVAVRESTLKRLRRVPAGNENWRPGPGFMSVADLARHILDADDWLLRKWSEPSIPAMQGRAGCAEVRSWKEYERLLDALDSMGRQRNDFIAGLTDDELSTIVPDARFSGEVDWWWVIVRGNLDHEIHHRGQIATYLRLLGNVTL